MTRHTLKLNDRYFDAVDNGIKTFEIRKNDRDYKVGDTLVLKKVNDEGLYITYPNDNLGINLDYEVKVVVKYILTHDDLPEGIPEGYVVMSIEKVKE